MDQKEREDEKARKIIWLSAPQVCGRELEYLEDALSSNWLSTQGSYIDRLERQFETFSGCSCLALSSGTAGIHLGLKLLGVEAGDEVVVPSLSFVASCNPIIYEGANPIFVDSETTSWNMDPQLLEDLLRHRAVDNRLPKAVIVVHVLGQCANLPKISEICKRYNVSLLEDAAHSLGATSAGRLAGTVGDIGVFSLSGSKVVTASSGGILLSKNKGFIEKARYWANQATDEPVGSIREYDHSELGYNYRLSNLSAAVGVAQMEHLGSLLAAKEEVAERYRKAFSDTRELELMPDAGYGRHTHWLNCLLLGEEIEISRDELIAILIANSVDSRPLWRPLHLHPRFRSFERLGGAVAESIVRRSVCLPSSTNLSKEDQEFVVKIVFESLGKERGQ